MTGAFCDRCGCSLPPGGSEGPAARFCTTCASVRTKPSRRWAPALGALLVAFLSGAAAWKLQALEGRLGRLESGAHSLAPEPAPVFSDAECQTLKALAAKPPAPPPDLEPLRKELEALKARTGPREGIPLALRPMPDPVQSAPLPEAPSTDVGPAADPAPDPGLSSKEPLARHRALAGLGRPSDAPAAETLLQDGMGFVRAAAADALGRIGSPASVGALIAMARSERDEAARISAFRALKGITGLDLDPAAEEPSLARCQAWLEARRDKENSP